MGFWAASPTIPPSVKAEAETTTRQYQAVIQRIATAPKSPLAGYVIGVYFLSTDPASVKSANEIRTQLVNQGLGARVRLYPCTPKCMALVVASTSLEVRYEEGSEYVQAKMVAEALTKQPLARTPHLRVAASTTKNFLSVFIPRDRKSVV